MKNLKIICTLLVVCAMGSALYLTYKDNTKQNYALFSAVRNGDIKTVNSLIKQGANLDIRDEAGQTPLHSSVYNGHTEIAELLLKNLAQVEIQDNRGGTALHWAATRGAPEDIELLIKNGAQIDIEDNFEMSPLNWAISENKVTNVKALLSHGANKTRTNSRGKNAIDYARQKENPQIIKLLEE